MVIRKKMYIKIESIKNQDQVSQLILELESSISVIYHS